MSADGWAILRQLVLAGADAVASGEQIAERLRLPAGFADPELAEIEIADYVMPVGPQKYLEVVGPMSERAYIKRWLDKVGGSGGYCLSVQVPDVAACAERAAELGVRMPVDTVVMGHRLLQLHPADAGILLELDGISDPGEWYWDDVTPGPRADAVITDIVGAQVGVPDPVATTGQWAHIIGLDAIGPTSLDFSGCRIDFVERTVGQLLGATFRLAPGLDSGPVDELLGVSISYVSAEADSAHAVSEEKTSA